MEYNLNRDFNESFSTAFKRFSDATALEGAVDRYVTSQGNQAGLPKLAEILVNMVYNYTPSLVETIIPKIYAFIKHNGNQAGMQEFTSILKAIIEEGISVPELQEEGLELVDSFVTQNACQSGLPILHNGVSYTFGAFLKQLIGYLSA